MRKRFYLLSLISFSFFLNAQQVTFEEYDLDNGLHVILHQDNTAPVVVTSVLYHVGAKNEEDDRTALHISLSTYFLKELKTSSVGIGLKLCHPMEEETMPTLLMILPTTTKCFLPII